MSKPVISTYQGSPVICLNPGDRFPFSLGSIKAKLVLENIEALKAFVASKGTTLETQQVQESPKAENTPPNKSVETLPNKSAEAVVTAPAKNNIPF